ncbi:MAG: DUF6515 family protein [Luteolibacter sp.]|uniref:DUF6515 family protein n=1 Tax=Luteolibacter sp. TaxID=1962973 RepID=UPI003267500C
MNLSIKPILIGSFGLALGSLLPSCVAPYPGPGQQATAVRVGYEVRTLPSGYRTEVVGGSRYFVHNGTYYRSRSGRYVVVEAPHGHYPPSRVVYVDRLPSGYRVVHYSGRQYYQVNDRYYQRSGNRYMIVSRPY